MRHELEFIIRNTSSQCHNEVLNYIKKNSSDNGLIEVFTHIIKFLVVSKKDYDIISNSCNYSYFHGSLKNNFIKRCEELKFDCLDYNVFVKILREYDGIQLNSIEDNEIITFMKNYNKNRRNKNSMTQDYDYN